MNIFNLKGYKFTKSLITIFALTSFIIVAQAAFGGNPVFASCTSQNYGTNNLTYNYCNSYGGHNYGCGAGAPKASNDMHPDYWDSSDGNWHYQMYVFVIDLEETSVQPDPNASDLSGLKVTSQQCNGSGAPGDEIDIAGGAWAYDGSTKPSDLYLGARSSDVRSGFNSAVLSETPGLNFNNPPVQSATNNNLAALMSDYGGFIIGGGGAKVGDHAVWCQNDANDARSPDPQAVYSFGLFTDANCGGDGSAWALGGATQYSRGFLLTQDFCTGSCDPSNYTWYSKFNANTDLGTNFTGHDAYGNLNGFTAHTQLGVGKYSPQNIVGEGIRTYVEAKYPILTSDFTPSCSGNISWNIRDALASNPLDNPNPSFHLDDGTNVIDISGWGTTGSLPIPSVYNSSFTLNITETVTLNGNVTKSSNHSLSCVALTCTSSISSITAIRDQNMDIPLSITIDPSTYNIPGGTISYQYNGGAIVTLSNFGSKTGIIDQKILALNINQSLGSATLTYWINTTNALTGNDQVVSQPLSISPCTITINATTEPTISVNGGDVVAGSIIDSNVTNCTDPYSDTNGDGIFTYNLGATGSYLGSGTSLAAQALGAITGFPTNLLAATKNNLDFADDGSGNYGGFGYAPCISIPTSLPSSNLGTIGQPAGLDIINLNTFNGTYSATSNASDYFSLGANTLSLSKDIVIYVDGNVSINDNQTYTTSGWNTVSAIPNLKIIASGDIYISPKVTQLDGTYIATGSIYTCSYTEQDYTAGNYANLANVKKYVNGTPSPCLSNLLVNGSLIAKSIYLQRTYGNVGAATPTAAETINYGPEDWLATVTTNTGTVDSYQELPPVY